MTKQGKYNVIGMLGLPAAAVAGGAIATVNGVWNAYTDTYVFLFGMNFGFMLFVGLLSGLLLLWSGGSKSRWLAVAPTLITTIYGGVWYLWRSVVPDPVAPAAEYVGALQYLLVIALAAFFIVLLLRVTGIVSRSA